LLHPEVDRGAVQILSAGAHIDPQSGACLLELASICAGERFSDHPRCVQPTLRSLCRLVNDGLDDPTRQTLMRFVPDIVRTKSNDPRLHPLIVLACLSYVERFETSRRLAGHRRRAARLLNRLERGASTRPRSLRVLIYQGLWVERALTDAATVAWHKGPDELVTLLAVGVAACEAESGTTFPGVVEGDVDRLEGLVAPHLGVRRVGALVTAGQASVVGEGRE
jgi:hypothetical protein